MNQPLPELSVIVPCYNEEENLPLLHEAISAALQGLPSSSEILYINDGSTDRTESVMLSLKQKDQRVRVIRLKRNSGLSAALTAGFESARGTYLVTLDADLQNDPADIPMLLSYMPAYDMAFGWRQKRNDNLIKVLSSRIANGVRNRLTGEQIPDIACTLKVFKRDCLRRIKMYKGMHRFLPTLFRIEGFRTIQVPVRHHPRKYGLPKYGVWNRVFVALVDCLVVRWMIRRSFHYEQEELP